MESVEQGDVEASYLLGFLDDYEGLDYETVTGYDDYEYRGRLKKEVSHNSLAFGLNDLHSNFKESSTLLGNELQTNEYFISVKREEAWIQAQERELLV